MNWGNCELSADLFCDIITFGECVLCKLGYFMNVDVCERNENIPIDDYYNDDSVERKNDVSKLVDFLKNYF